MMHDEFKKISLNGRVSYAIKCLENTLISLKYELDEWEVILEFLWSFTSIEYLDRWSGIISEIIPENLLEFDSYERHEFEYIDEKLFQYLYRLYEKVDEKIDFIMTKIYDIGASHSYSVITDYGKESLLELEGLINYMIQNNITLPDLEPFYSFSFEENKGWGDKFNGKELSSILN